MIGLGAYAWPAVKWIATMLAFQQAMGLAGKAGEKLIGTAEGAGTRAAGSRVGKGIDKGLGRVGAALPAAIGSRLGVGPLVKGLSGTAGGLGALAVGGYAAETMSGLLDSADPGSAAMEINQMIPPQVMQQQQGIQELMDDTALRQALAEYLGDRNLADELLGRIV
jgi:hypothetical protein